MGKKRNKFIDAHCHVSLSTYGSEYIIDEIVQAAKHNKIEFMINNGGHKQENYEVIELAKKYPELFKACIGIHPEDAPTGDEYLEIEELYLKEKQHIVGIGEIGLEYFYDHGSSRESQILALENQIQLALKYDLPCVVHLRDKENSTQAYEDFYQLMTKYPKLRVMLHTYAGNLEYAKKFLEFNNLYFSFSGVVTFGSSKQTKELICSLPIERILTETDSPYLRVHPYTGEKNEPNTVVYVAYYIAGLKGIGMDKFVDRVNRNLRNLFNLKNESN